MTYVTSAGQAAGIGVIAAGGSYLELALTQFCINLRYALMGLSLSQKLDQTFQHMIHRFLTAYGITDEIFAVAVSQDGQISAPYLYGLRNRNRKDYICNPECGQKTVYHVLKRLV